MEKESTGGADTSAKHTHTFFTRPAGRQYCLHTYALGIPPDGFLVMPILQLLPISQEKYLLLLIVGALKKKKKKDRNCEKEGKEK